jgi:hypothetical protein
MNQRGFAKSGHHTFSAILSHPVFDQLHNWGNDSRRGRTFMVRPRFRRDPSHFHEPSYGRAATLTLIRPAHTLPLRCP